MTGITAEAILAHPHFGEARQAHLDALVALIRDDPLAQSLMADAGLIILRGVLVGSYFAFDAEDRATWPTPGNLKRVLVERGLASPRRVDDLLARFRQAGWMTIAPAPSDRRINLLTPTPPVLAHDRAHLAAYHRFLLVLFPGRGYEWVLGADENIHRALRAATWRDLPRGTSALEHAAIRLFLARDAGYLALVLVAQAQLSGREGPSWTALADTLGVARSHLRTLFGEAEAAGYVRLHPGQRQVELLPVLWTAYDRFLAGVQADQDALAQAVFGSRDMLTHF